MKAVIISLCTLFLLANSCNDNNKTETDLSEKNTLTERQLYTIHLQNTDERSTNITTNDSIAIGGGDPLPPCPDSSFTDCCPSVKYISFNKDTKNIKIVLLDNKDNPIQTFTTDDLMTLQDSTLVFQIKKMKSSICDGKNKLQVTTNNKKPYNVMFKK
ncbi:hypothetical protein [uncultured Olleya sp.]|uniref:hypothetical protein n=1 Tax=uncultured Olleya sp. TaxID=757243 RepID=UPI002594E60B|nr:hypothetical protein [uncultured Olleya sp.]